MEKDLVQIGLRIRQARKSRGLTLDELARRTDLSKGLLSKIENFRTIPSLPVLTKIARSLNEDMGQLVMGIGTTAPSLYQLIRKDQRSVVERDEAVGFTYQALTSHSLGQLFFEAFVLRLEPKSFRKPVTTEGDQMVFILQGKIDFRYGKEIISMRKGDTLFFDGRVPHVPVNTGRQAAELLSIYLLRHH